MIVWRLREVKYLHLVAPDSVVLLQPLITHPYLILRPKECTPSIPHQNEAGHENIYSDTVTDILTLLERTDRRHQHYRKQSLTGERKTT